MSHCCNGQFLDKTNEKPVQLFKENSKKSANLKFYVNKKLLKDMKYIFDSHSAKFIFMDFGNNKKF